MNVTSAQLTALDSLVSCPRSGTLDADSPIAQWLVSTPTTAFYLSPDSLRNGFLSQVTCYTKDRKFVQRQECLVVPQHTLLNNFVLGSFYLRSHGLNPDTIPDRYRPRTGNHLREGSDVHSVATHFALDMESGVIYHSSLHQHGTLIIGMMRFTTTGFLDTSAHVIDASGTEVTRISSIPLCQFCCAETGRGSACLCPPAMRQRVLGKPVGFESWGRLLDMVAGAFRQARLLSSLRFEGAQVDFPAKCPDVHELLYRAGDDAAVAELRLSYLNFLLTISVIASGPSALQDRHDDSDGQHNHDPLGTESLDTALSQLLLDPPDLGDFSNLDEAWPLYAAPPERITASSRACPGVVCSQCGKSLLKTNHLRRHIAGVHETRRAFRCEQCDASFTQASNLKRHLESVHLHYKPYPCQICSQPFATLSNLQRHHKRRHGDSEFVHSTPREGLKV